MHDLLLLIFFSFAMESVGTMATSLLPLTTSIPAPMSDVLWMVVVGFLVLFILSIATGSNDVANSFGTSVGAKVIDIKILPEKIIRLHNFSGNHHTFFAIGKISAFSKL